MDRVETWGVGLVGSLRLGPYRLDLLHRELLNPDGTQAPLRRKSLNVLLALAIERGHVVSKEALLDAVWPGTVVTDDSLAQAVADIRRLLGPHASLLRTVPRRGYLLDAQLADAPVPGHDARLVGRNEDLERLDRLLTEHRLVSLVGPGGIGKTRLARALAQRVAARFADGIGWVELSALSTGERIAASLAQAIHLTPGDGDEPHRLLRVLSGKAMLLVLDNCEHLTDTIAPWVSDILAAAPRTQVLTTSRQPIGVNAEWTYRVDPLSVPEEGTPWADARGYGALQLLELRAQALDRHFVIDADNVGQAVALCRQLDGLALAIEMAAARLPLLGFDTLQHHLGDHLQLLRTQATGTPARQQTLLATLDWSHDLLDAREQRVLRRVAMFAGTFRVGAAQSVGAFDDLDAWDVLDALDGLVRKSMLSIEPGTPPRCRLAETTRVYARQHLEAAGETAAAQSRHGQAMASLAREAAGSDMPETQWLARYRLDYDDLAEAFERAVARRDADIAAAVVGTLRQLDQLRGMLSGSTARVPAALTLMAGASPLAEARLCSFVASCGWVAMPQDRRTDMARRAVQCWRGLDDQQELHHAVARAATETARSGCVDEAEALVREARALEGEHWPPLPLARRAYHEGNVALCQGDARRYRDCSYEAMVWFEQAGSARLAAQAHLGVLEATVMAGDLDRALSLGNEVVASFRELDQPAYMSSAMRTVCAGRLMADDLAGARSVATQAMRELDRSVDSSWLVTCAALIAARSGRIETATRLLGHSERGARPNPEPLDVVLQDFDAQTARIVQSRLAPHELVLLRAAGAGMEAAQASDLVASLLADTSSPSQMTGSVGA